MSAEQIRKLKRIAADRGYRLVPGHDPVVWPALTAELATRTLPVPPAGREVAPLAPGGHQ